MTFWQVTRCAWEDTPKAWEPFAATDGESGATVWLRQAVQRPDAAVAVMPGPRLEAEVDR